MRLAIIGAGISGLVCARCLSREHEVVVFEAEHRVGGHTHTVDVDWNGEKESVDTGFIVFNREYYPNFVQLLETLGVESKETTMSLSVRDDRNGLEYAGRSLNALFAQRRNLARPAFWRMIAAVLRFQRQGAMLLSRLDDRMTVREFAAAYGYGREFVEWFLEPMGSALWSAPLSSYREFPIRFVVEFLRNHGMMQIFGRPPWRVIKGGSKTYLAPLIHGLEDRIRCGTRVNALRRYSTHVEVDGERFDEAILACHSDQALAILGPDATGLERDLLGRFPYQSNPAVLHTDTSVLPRSRRAWACWNYHLADWSDQAAAVTYNMNMLQGLRTRQTFCVSLNEPGIDPDKVIRRIEYHHPVYRPGRDQAQARHRDLIRNRRTSFCGAYWGYGFHEDGVRSALAVCRGFGVGLAA